MTADTGEITIPGNLALYHPIDKFDLGWGVKVTNVGFANIRLGEVYPPHRHPSDYMFSWNRGRRLPNCHILFIGRGGGILETEHGGTARLESGDVFILHPGEWHRYRPQKAVGWTERWCGLSGSYVEQVLGAFFNVNRPVVKGVPATAVRQRFRRITRFFMDGRTVHVPKLVAEAVGLLTDIAPFAAIETRPFSNAIASSCDEMASRIHENIDLEELARRHGMGYSLFRRLFKKQMGFSPHAYVVEMRINRARALLRNTSLTVEQVGSAVGFSSLAYFSYVFQKHVGLSPNAWRLNR
ncbi:MAG: AraC family transcriptional regulator [Kiritimatiellae bacterium]|nr:AraC family transcriptional regulator [Kiritimatiellia bacterium]